MSGEAGMKWERPTTGKTKIITKFLLLPKTLPNATSGGSDTRWLETARIQYKYTRGPHHCLDQWKANLFVDRIFEGTKVETQKGN